MSQAKLPRDFYTRDCLTVSKNLLGKVLTTETDGTITAGIITETEAYLGLNDPACHSFKAARDGRVKIHYEVGGHAYVYLIYGMYYCFNIVTGPVNVPEVVLIRALEPLEGIDVMKERRGKDDIRRLCDGPGKLCDAMGIDKRHYGADLCGDKIYLLDRPDIPEAGIVTTKRINIDYAGDAKDWPYRFYIKGNKYISRP